MTDAAKIVVTGTGAVCASGTSPDDILDAVVAGRSAIGPINISSNRPCQTIRPPSRSNTGPLSRPYAA